MIVGVLSGLLGVGGGFITMPLFIYILGVPTIIAVGTSLFQTIFTVAIGATTHALKGNVDLLLVILILPGSAIGAQLGALTGKRIKSIVLRYYFSWITYLAATIILVKILIGR